MGTITITYRRVITFIISLFSYAASVDDYNAKIIDTIESIKVLSDEVKSYDNNDTGDLDILLSKAYYEIKGSRKFFDTSENKISRTIASLADVQLYIKDINKDNDEYLNKIYDTVQEKITTLESLERP